MEEADPRRIPEENQGEGELRQFLDHLSTGRDA
jgi:hypothetical protein